MKTDLFDYELPQELIAQEPVEPRDASRLLVLRRATGQIEHLVFRDLPRHLPANSCLVLNDTRVIPARIFGRRPTGGKVELLLLEAVEHPRLWRALVRPAARLGPRSRVFLDADLQAEIIQYYGEGQALVGFAFREEAGAGRSDLSQALSSIGVMPLPPYIKKPLVDRARYQTVYSRAEGSVAAPTAGLHFTPSLLQTLQEQGIRLAYVTLHVGLDTFRPVKVEDITEHRMHSEFCQVPAETVDLIRRTKEEGGRIIAVGTTVVRTLESAASSGQLVPWAGRTSLFIYPGYRFRVIDGMLTNFHLPRSTLLMLVSAFAGDQHGVDPLEGSKMVLGAYRAAVQERYRFFSFGDAMLIL